MLKSLKIKGFRVFETFEVEDLARVNLFVGKNNSGKTTILEATEILLSDTNPTAVIFCARRRGEILIQRDNNDRINRIVDISHLFHGHKGEEGSNFEISGESENGTKTMLCGISTNGQNAPEPLFVEGDELKSRLFLKITYNNSKEPLTLPLIESGGVSMDFLRSYSTKKGDEVRVSFVRTESWDSAELSRFWDSIALTADENKIIDILRILEPKVEKIAFLSQMFRFGTPVGGIYVKMKNLDDRIPLGSLGDGIKHLLVMSLAVVHSNNGFVMIDEIDTGLHHSVMLDMWRVLIETARHLNVQIFATTHSLDCVRSLAQLFDKEPNLNQEVRLHRIEPGHNKAIAYEPSEILTAAKQHMEIRG